jgi:integrase
MAPTRKLTRKLIDAEPLPTDGRAVLWDSDLKGFGVRITSKGARSYIVKYRTALGEQRWLTLGDATVRSPDDARRQARGALADVLKGGDPAAVKQAGRIAATFGELLNLYLTEWVEVRNKPATQKEFKRLVERHIRPALGSMRIESVQRKDITKLHADLNGTPRQANHVLSVLSKVFNFAESKGLRAEHSNPCRLIDRFDENKRDRYLNGDELARVGAALNAPETNLTLDQQAAITLLLLTGLRLTEAITLEWSWIDTEAGVARLPDAKGGAREHPLGAAVITLLGTVPKVENSPFVFHGSKGQRLPLGTLEGAWKRVRTAAKLTDARIHDLRHTAGTAAGLQTGGNAFLVRDLLGHKTLAMTGRYVSKARDPLRTVADSVASGLAAALGRLTLKA